MDLTDEQWAVLEPLIPEPPRRADGRGRPWKPAQDVLNGILWILRTGARLIRMIIPKIAAAAAKRRAAPQNASNSATVKLTATALAPARKTSHDKSQQNVGVRPNVT